MAVEKILRSEEKLWAPEHLRKAANLQDFQGEYRRSLEDPEGFWGAWARRFYWEKPFERVLEWNLPEHRWFLGGTTNAVYNALERNVERGLRNKVALLYLSEEGQEAKLTYGELLDRVRRLATALKALGVGKGDRVVIYMPLTLEGILAMLATAYLGAIHSVVYAGLGVGALRERILDAGAKLLIAGDVSYRRGKVVDLRSIAEEAIRDLPLKVVWFQRLGKAELPPGHYDFEELLFGHPPEARAEMVEAEHPLFILYTSGSTGKPKGVVHVHGGYMVGTTYHLRTFFDVKDDDLFWATSDIGWIVGHSYIVYAPLLEGITSVLREGAPDYPDPGAIWRAVERYRVNVMFTAPTAVRMFMKFGPEWPKKYDLSSLAPHRRGRGAPEPRGPALRLPAPGGRGEAGLRGRQLVADGAGRPHPGHPPHPPRQARLRRGGPARGGGGGGGRGGPARAPGAGRASGPQAPLPPHDAHRLGQPRPLPAVLAGGPRQRLHGRGRGQPGRGGLL
jgi:acetyl-CoA synthetase